MPNPQIPHYGQAGVRYNEGFFYGGPPAQPKTKKTMASLSLNLSRKNPTQLIALADVVLPKLAPAAPALPPIPNMATKAAGLTTKRATAKTANDAYIAALAALVTLKQARDQTADVLRTEHTSVAKAVESEAKGDPVLLSASGYPLAQDHTASGAPPG